MNELETVAWVEVNGRHVQLPVLLSYELDGYVPLGLWVSDEDGNDITEQIDPAEYAILHEKAERHSLEYMTEAADYLMEDR